MLRLVALLHQFPLDCTDELDFAFLLDGLDRASIHPRGTAVALDPNPRYPQHFPLTDLVVQNPKGAAQILLGRLMQLTLQYSDLSMGALSQACRLGSHQPFLFRISSSQSRGPSLPQGFAVLAIDSTMSPSDFPGCGSGISAVRLISAARWRNPYPWHSGISLVTAQTFPTCRRSNAGACALGFASVSKHASVFALAQRARHSRSPALP